MIKFVKNIFLPNRPVPCRILFGPLRGARPLMNPRVSIRYILGIYEHELNGWLHCAIREVDWLWDIGANHGYFCFGVMSSWKRHGKRGDVWAFEPQSEEVQRLRTAAEWHSSKGINLTVEQGFVGASSVDGAIVLDEYVQQNHIAPETMRSLVKIDVEGAELKVLEGCTRMLRDGNLFLVEVHSSELLEKVQHFFSQHQHPVNVVTQKPLPIFGRECRSEENWWIVSQL